MPNDFSDDEVKSYLITDTDSLHMVQEYVGQSMDQILQMDHYTFTKLLINSVIHDRRKTKEGQEWLELCWTLQQTEMDTEGLRRKLNKE